MAVTELWLLHSLKIALVTIRVLRNSAMFDSLLC